MVGQLAPSESTVIRSYPELARELANMISNARTEIYLASRYYEPAVGSKLLAKFAEGVAIHVIDGNSSGVSFEERIRTASAYDSKNRGLILKLLDSPDAIIRVRRLDYSFIVVDGKYCGFELIDPANPDDFNCALRYDDSELAEVLIHTFQNLASVARPGNATPKVETKIEQ